jgi:hypothetical protein
MAVPVKKPKQLAKRAAAGAPLAKGVKGRQEALMNMAPNAREAAEIKTKVRSATPKNAKGKQNIVNRYSKVVTGSTKKTSKFTVRAKRAK